MNFLNKAIISTLTATTILTGGLTASEVQAQKVVNINPTSNNKSVSPETSISGVFKTTDGIQVNADSVKIYLDDRNITKSSTITDNFFSYKPSQPLSSGLHVVKMEYENTKGEEKVVSWNFYVEQPSNELKISSVSHNANKPLGQNATFLATVKGTPNADVDILLFQDGKRMIEIPAQEVSQGVYVGTYNLNSTVKADQGVVVGRLSDDQQMIYDAAPQGFRFDDDVASIEAPSVQVQPKRTLKPEITNYDNGDKVSGNGFVLEGKTKPNATVDVEVSSQVSVINNSFFNVNLGSNTFYETEVKADKYGNFVVTVPAPGSIAPGTTYNVKAIASNQRQTSQPVELTLTQK